MSAEEKPKSDATAESPFALHDLVMKGDTAALSALLEKTTPAMLHYAELECDTTLAALAASCNSLPMLQLVVAHGSSPRAVCQHLTAAPLVLAARAGNVEMLAWLVDACGVDPGMPIGATGNTALFTAALNGRREAVRYLLGLKQLVTIDTYHTDMVQTPLTAAATEKHYEIAEMLLDAGANPNARCGSRQTTLLDHAARTGDVRLIDLLFAHAKTAVSTEIGTRMGAADSDDAMGSDWNITPLMRAVCSDHTAAVACLLDHGADPAARTALQGHTPLCLATSAEVADLLLATGKAGPEVPTTAGDTPMSLAVTRKQMPVLARCVAWLGEAGAAAEKAARKLAERNAARRQEQPEHKTVDDLMKAPIAAIAEAMARLTFAPSADQPKEKEKEEEEKKK